MKRKNVLLLAALTLMSGAFTACSDDDSPSNGGETINPSEVSFIVTSEDHVKSLRGGARMKVYTDLETTKSDELVYGDSTNTNVAYSPDGFTQVKYNSQAGFFSGYIYRQGSVDAAQGGIGSGKMGVRTYAYANGKLTETGTPNIITNFGNVGIFGNYTYAAMNSDLTVNYFTSAGKMTTWTAPDLSKYAVDGTAPVITDIMDLGNNRLALALYYSNRDSAAVAFTDYSFSTISSVVFDSRIGGVYGAWRSARYDMGGVTDSGDAYFFCGTSANGSKVGALRVKSGATTFDPDYQFDLYTASDGYRFRKAYPISGSKFLLEFYTSKDDYSNMSTSGKLAVVDMESKTFTWVTGFPEDVASISIGYGDGYDGYYYLPISPAESGSTSTGGGWKHAKANAASSSSIQPAIYKINATTGVASVFMTFNANEQVKAINIIKK